MADLTSPNNDLILDNRDLVVKDGHGISRLVLQSASGSVFGRDSAGKLIAKLDVEHAALFLGGENRQDGDIVLFPKQLMGGVQTRDAAHSSVRLEGKSGNVVAGGGGIDGVVSVCDRSGQATIVLSGRNAGVEAGGRGLDAKLRLRNASGATTLSLEAASGNLTLGGAGGTDGDLLMLDAQGVRRIHLNAGGGAVDDATTVHLDGVQALARLGGARRNGGLVLRNDDAHNVAVMVAESAGASLQLRDGSGKSMVEMRSDQGEGRIRVADKDGRTTVEISGAEGDVELIGADCAEDFEIAGTAGIVSGTVMVVDEDGRLTPCRREHDRRVAGVVSGAGGLRPGIVLGRGRSTQPSLPIALAGRVFCLVDADRGAVAVGDLLTTSATPGHAMRAGSIDRAFGATLGKALAPLAEGRRMIPVLVALQ